MGNSKVNVGTQERCRPITGEFGDIKAYVCHKKWKRGQKLLKSIHGLQDPIQKLRYLKAYHAAEQGSVRRTQKYLGKDASPIAASISDFAEANSERLSYSRRKSIKKAEPLSIQDGFTLQSAEAKLRQVLKQNWQQSPKNKTELDWIALDRKNAKELGELAAGQIDPKVKSIFESTGRAHAAMADYHQAKVEKRCEEIFREIRGEILRFKRGNNDLMVDYNNELATRLKERADAKSEDPLVDQWLIQRSEIFFSMALYRFNHPKKGQA